MKHNSLGDDVPIVVILRAMGAMSDQEIVQLVRLFFDERLQALACYFEDCISCAAVVARQ